MAKTPAAYCRFRSKNMGIEIKMKKLQNKLKRLFQKREKMNMAHMESYKNGSATRARTTTHNARVSDLNKQIQEVREEIKIDGVGNGN
jgi:hypothetical protein